MAFGRFGFRSSAEGMDSEALGNALADWLQSPAGAYFLDCEQRLVNDALTHTAGYRGMLLKALSSEFNIDLGPQLHKFTLAPFPVDGASALSDLDALPLPSSVLDVAVLHHVLDVSEFPHEALKESARVVQASGHLVLLGFNPWSFFGLCVLVRRLCRCRGVWRSRCLSVSRATDWLRFVGFQPERILYGAYRPPLQAPKLLVRLGFLDRLATRLRLPTGSLYVIVARKIRLKPIRGTPEWLPSAIKPVKLASRARANKTDHCN